MLCTRSPEHLHQRQHPVPALTWNLDGLCFPQSRLAAAWTDWSRSGAGVRPRAEPKQPEGTDPAATAHGKVLMGFLQGRGCSGRVALLQPWSRLSFSLQGPHPLQMFLFCAFSSPPPEV